MEFHGDTAGIAALKALYAKDKGYLKFLLGEARSNTDFIARFTDDDGHKWQLKFDPRTGDLDVSAVAG